MKTSNLVVQLLVFGAIVALFAVGFLVVTNWASVQAALTAGGSAQEGVATINSIAESYYGTLTRAAWPDVSFGLGIWTQVAISVVLVVLMAITGLIFPKARTFIILLTIFAVGRHILWRGFETLNFSSIELGIVSTLLYVAEVVAFISLMLGYFQIWKPTNREGQPLITDGQAHLPSVDVMVCTYNEPVSVVYRTLVGCQGIDYPRKQVFLLDDGRRQEMQELAAHLGVTYITRDKNTHAKAGNLNNALPQTHGDLILVFDADHVPSRNFLTEVVGFFQRDNKLAYLQTPQHFFTIDPFQRNLVADDVVTNEQDYFFHVIQPGNDHWNAAFFAGSGAIFRRSCLEEIDGFAVETVTEDVHTGMRLHKKGYKSAFFNRNLAAGLAQDSFADFVKQRLRWARGMTQIFFHDHPFFTPGLSLAQRLCYFSGIWYFFNGVHRLTFLVAPLFFLLFGFMTINASIMELAVYYVPSFLCLFWGYSLLSYGYRHLFWAEIYETALCVYMSMAAVGSALFPRRSKFLVTPKGTVSERLFFNWKVVIPQIAIAALIVVGLGVATIRAFASPGYIPGILTNLLWAGYNLFLLIGAIYVAQERPQFRLAPRVERRVRCELRLLDGTIAVGYTTNISETGLSVTFDEPVPLAGTMALKLLDWDNNETSILQVQAVRSVVDKDNRHYIGLRAVNRTDEQHQKLIRHMFGTADVRGVRAQDRSIGKALSSLFTVPFRLGNSEEVALRRRTPRFQAQLPCMVEAPNGQPVQGTTQEVSETGLSVVVPNKAGLKEGQPARVQLQWANGESALLTTVVRRLEDAGNGNVNAGLNFTQLNRQQRLDLIRQIYGPRDGLIRVAPAVSKMVPCTLVRSNGDVLPGTSQEMSEMGVRLHLKQSAQLRQEEPVRIQLQWEDGTVTQLDGLLINPDVQSETFQAGGPGSAPVIVYFRSASLKELDALSERMLVNEPNNLEAV